MAFPFMLVGFGTKMGLAPGHNWLPDAHSEAPSPISAMLSATLLNAAFIGILRLDILMGCCGLGHYSRTLLITMGVVSLFVSAVFIVRARNFKRMLAYSSIENMGLLALGAGIGGLGLFAAMLHMIGHSLSKAAFFLGSGNLYAIYHSKDISSVRGLLRRAPLSAWLWVASALALCAFPPFATFISKFMLLSTLIKQGHFVLLALVMLLLTVILYGLASNVFRMVFGEAPPEEHAHPMPIDAAHGLGFSSTAPQIFLLGIAAVIGIYIPGPVLTLLQGAAEFLKVAQ